MKKILLLGLLTFLLTVSTAFAAGDFKIQNETGADLLTLERVSGKLNVTVGKIAEEGVLLEDRYCTIAGGCGNDAEYVNLNVTTLLNASGATLIFDNDSILEQVINFTTVCGTGNHLYINNGNLACEADADTDTDTHVAGDGIYLYNDTNTMYLNETKLNVTIDARITAADLLDEATAATLFVNRTNWTTHDDYPAACPAGDFVTQVGDTLTCSTPAYIADTDTHVAGDGDYLTNDSTTMYFNVTKLNATIDDRDTDTHAAAVGPYLYNDTTSMYFNETKLNSTIDDRSAVADVWVNESGDTMTGTLVMEDANIDLQGGNITSTTGDVIIVLTP